MSKAENKGGSLTIFWIMALAVSLVTLVFTLQNYDKQTIRFFWMSINDVPLAVVIFSCLLLGAIITLLFSVPSYFRRRKERQVLIEEINELRKQLKKKNQGIPGVNDSVE